MVKNYSLIIKDVAEEDAGNYTIILSLRQWNLSKNLTVTLKVNGEFAACSHTSQHKQLSCHWTVRLARSRLLWTFSWKQIQARGVGMKDLSWNQQMDAGFHWKVLYLPQSCASSWLLKCVSNCSSDMTLSCCFSFFSWGLFWLLTLQECSIVMIIGNELLLIAFQFLLLIVKPQIYENAVSSFPDPNLYLLSSKQVLTCTVYGIPPPKITWMWYPCRQNHSKTR